MLIKDIELDKPSLIFHEAMLPSVIVGDIAGILKGVAAACVADRENRAPASQLYSRGRPTLRYESQ